MPILLMILVRKDCLTKGVLDKVYIKKLLNMKKINEFLSCISYTQAPASLELSKAQLRERLCITYLFIIN